MNYEKILLINPSILRPDYYKKYSQAIPVMVPLSLGYLAGYLHREGISAEIYDEQLEPLNENKLKEFINNKGFGVVGISSTTMYIKRSFMIADMVKRISRKVKVIFGGVHPTVLPESCLNNESVDIVVRQEGEITLYELIKSFNNNMELKEIDGISYKNNGMIVHRPDRPMQKNLDSFPPFPYHIFANQKNRYRFQVLSSRGCPYKCIFCSARAITGFRMRYDSAERVINAIEYLANNLNKTKIAFADDTFTVNKKHVKEICRLLVQKGLHKKVSLYCASRGNTVDKEILETMKGAGFKGLYFGIETASGHLMDIIEKGETVDDNVVAVKLAKQVGLKTRGTFMLGLPTETKDESWETIKLALKLPLDFASFSIATPYPGTRLFEIAKGEGFKPDDFSKFDIVGGLLGKQIPYVPKGRTYEEIRHLQKKAYLKFYLRPKQIFTFFMTEIPDLNLKTFNLWDRFLLVFKVFLGQFKTG